MLLLAKRDMALNLRLARLIGQGLSDGGSSHGFFGTVDNLGKRERIT